MSELQGTPEEQEIDEYTDIVQIPAIFVNGKALTPLSQYTQLDTPTLRDIADVMGGEVRYLKLRATYTFVETDLCSRRDCFRPVGKNSKDGRCSDHALKAH